MNFACQSGLMCVLINCLQILWVLNAAPLYYHVSSCTPIWMKLVEKMTNAILAGQQYSFKQTHSIPVKFLHQQIVKISYFWFNIINILQIYNIAIILSLFDKLYIWFLKRLQNIHTVDEDQNLFLFFLSFVSSIVM